MGLGPVRYMTISVHTTSVQVFRQIRNLNHFGTCKRSTTSVYTTSVHSLGESNTVDVRPPPAITTLNRSSFTSRRTHDAVDRILFAVRRSCHVDNIYAGLTWLCRLFYFYKVAPDHRTNVRHAALFSAYLTVLIVELQRQ